MVTPSCGRPQLRAGGHGVAYYARCRLSLRGRLKSFNSQISEQKLIARTRECCQIDARESRFPCRSLLLIVNKYRPISLLWRNGLNSKIEMIKQE
ncbi:hypothetical protein ALC57_02513 [Trachymyrmex cornetzi]|uniref:Uncharacterized protein n=1 Tax=Trachymyrmex cornetzi TaxID=471704 RepID=A0A195EJJ0_9HYME|nr:hypothetical protein ALC57_02513 [Trachymyrmex cornetzi]